MIRKPRIGDIVHITCLDHSRSSGDPQGKLEFEVFGRLFAEDTKGYFIGTWMHLDGEINADTESFYILKSTIVKARRLR